MARPQQRMSSHASHFMLPAQLLLGLLFLAAGSLLLLKKIGRDYVPFIPEEILVYVCAFGSALGGLYLFITRIWRPRLYF